MSEDICVHCVNGPKCPYCRMPSHRPEGQPCGSCSIYIDRRLGEWMDNGHKLGPNVIRVADLARWFGITANAIYARLMRLGYSRVCRRCEFSEAYGRGQFCKPCSALVTKRLLERSEDVSAAEVASELGISMNAAHLRLSRARRAGKTIERVS